jgi:hypothetical protein
LEKGVNAPNGACKSPQLNTNHCEEVYKNDHKKCHGNTHVSGTTVPNPSKCDEGVGSAGHSTPDYTYEEMKTIVDNYVSKDYAYDLVQAKADTEKEIYDKAKKDLDTATFSIKLVCDKKKWTFTEYDELECKGEAKEFSAEWGQCVKGPDGSYIKVTGAIALKAAAAALVAFAGSQF